MTCFLLRLQLCTCLTNRWLRHKWSLTRAHGGFLLIQAPANVNACCLTLRQMKPFVIWGLFIHFWLVCWHSDFLVSLFRTLITGMVSGSIVAFNIDFNRWHYEHQNRYWEQTDAGNGRVERSVHRQVSQNMHWARTGSGGPENIWNVTWREFLHVGRSEPNCFANWSRFSFGFRFLPEHQPNPS